MIVRRSNLIMPANRPAFVEKSWSRGADSITLDLEDSVASAEKLSARENIRQSIQVAGKGGSDVIVRVNNDPELLAGDIDASVYPGLNGIMLPKVESAQQIEWVEKRIAALEKERDLEAGSVLVNVVIESARGFVHLEEIMAACTRVESLWLGTEDFTNDLGMKDVEPEALLYPKLRVLIMAVAHGITPRGMLGSIANYKDLDLFFESARKSYQFGYKGCSCIHPSQVSVLNRAFAPEKEDVEQAQAVVNAYLDSVQRGIGATKLNGKMIDLPIYERYQKILEFQKAIEEKEAKKARCMSAVNANAEV